MLFPNHPAYAEIRAGMGMGYQPGAHALLGYSAPYHGMGDFSSSMETAAIKAGVAQQSDLDLLNSLGATDIDLENLIQGIVTLPQLYAQYGVTIPADSTAVANTTPSPSVFNAPAQGPSISQAGQVPSGSTLLYTCTVNTPPLTSGQDIINGIAPQLPGHGMSMISSQVSKSGTISGPTLFSMTVLDSVGHALQSDAKSVMDGLVENFLGAGNLELQSSLSIVAPGITATGLPQPQPSSNAVAWLENNALYIGAAVAALILINNFTGKRR